MKKLTLGLDALQVQSFVIDEARAGLGTVHGRATGLQDTDCSAVDACPSARGCSDIAECPPSKDPNGCQSQVDACETRTPDCRTAQCPSADDACPSGRACPPQA
jgi:hypothetical protein